jgi:hypothetical protein
VYEEQLCFILGGILGLKGNMTLTMLVFAIHMETFVARFRDRARVTIQIGGDDFFVAVSKCLRSVKFELLDELKTVTKRHMGHLKEFHITECSCNQLTLPSSRYCKKSFEVVPGFDGRHKIMKVRTLPKLPLMLEQLVCDELNPRREKELLMGVHDVTKHWPIEEERLQAFTLLIDVATSVFGSVSTNFERSVPKVLPSSSFVIVNGHYYTHGAIDIINRVESVDYPLDALRFRTTIESKLQYLLLRESTNVAIIRCRVNNKNRSVVCLDSQRRRLTDQMPFSLEPSCLRDELFNMCVREYLTFLTELKGSLEVLEEEVRRIVDVPQINLAFTV